MPGGRVPINGERRALWGLIVLCLGAVIASHIMPAMMGSDMLNQPPNPECEAAVEAVQQDSGLKLRIMAIVRTLAVIAAAVAGNASSS